ncbi:flagellar motor switch protein FliM [Fodinibius salsisoli]|uniref:Flagellar motor switch protein FliM n=1 Tax=Fodinibius salsisoli TaxID=2820877 RepID=A0ABT3PHZ0_9BACT|nr:FliM/FliN family flagellar motor switch protein [Fodinibius salsisoli]MCW9705368.1 FliM/FliN family flagellar motor switch protein [Fodinibius salsisoli]
MESQEPGQQLGNVKYVETYDFKQPKLFSKEIMRNLRSLHDIFARSISRIFGSALRKKVDVSLEKIDQLSSSKFINKIKSPSVIYLLSVDDSSSGNIIMVMPPGFCIHLVERQSGGYGGDISERRTLTTIEEKIVSRIVNNITDEILMAWEPYMEFEIQSSTFESKPENIHMASVDPTIVVQISVSFGDKKANFHLSYPYSLLKEAMNNSVLKKGKKTETVELTDEQLKSYKYTLSDAAVSIKPLLGETTISVQDIIGLKEGDVIPLEQRTDQPLKVKVNNVHKMSAYPGVIHGRRAVKIYDLIEEINEQEVI